MGSKNRRGAVLSRIWVVLAIWVAAVLPSQPADAGTLSWLRAIPQERIACPRGIGLGDGCPTTAIVAQGNPLAAIHRDFFSGYAAQTSGPQASAGIVRGLLSNAWRPAWNIAGVDYAVGVPAGRTLLDPVANSSQLPKGCSLSTTAGYQGVGSSYSVACNGGVNGSANNGVTTGTFSQAKNVYTPLTFDGWDFSTHSVRLIVTFWDGPFTFQNGRIGGAGGPNQATQANAWWIIDTSYARMNNGACNVSTEGCFHLYNNAIDGDVRGFDTAKANANTAAGRNPGDAGYVNPWWGGTLFQPTTGFAARYNYITNVNTRIFDTGTSHYPSLDDYCSITNNYIEGIAIPSSPINDHGEITELQGPCGHSFYRYNTFLEPTKNGYNNLTASSAPGTVNGASVSGWIYPNMVNPAACTGVTFTGNTGTVTNSGACGGPTGGVGAFTGKADDQWQRTAPGVHTTLAVTDGSGQVINGYVTQFNGQDATTYTGGKITSITMSASNEIPTAVSFQVIESVPEWRIDHNTFVNNYWDGGATGFGAMIGVGIADKLRWDVFENHDNWFDTTGAALCYAVTNPVAGAAARSTSYIGGANYDLLSPGVNLSTTVNDAGRCGRLQTNHMYGSP